MKIIYEKHPVTPERKQELRSQGYTIIDARFAPVGYAHDAAQGEAAAHQNDERRPTAGDELENMTLDELKKVAKDLGVRIHANSGADKFIEAIRAAGSNGEAE